MSETDELAATQRWLALEHEAIWTYGLIGARFADLADRARAQDAAHRRTRDRLHAAVRILGGRPVATQTAYAVADPADAATARVLAQDVEARIVAACVSLVAVTTERNRDSAVEGARTAATAGLRWGAAPEPFPGLD